MRKKPKKLVIHKFQGQRFADHSLDVDVLPDLIAYKNILVETAKELWRRKNPNRERLPKNFEDSLNLKFFNLEKGSTEVPLYRELVYEENDLLFPPEPDELDEAVELTAEAIEACNSDQPLPENFPKSSLARLSGYGKTLRDDESFEHRIEEKNIVSVYTPTTRQRFQQWAESNYNDEISFIGEVRAADLDGSNFTIRLEDGQKVKGKFAPDQEQMIITALKDHDRKMLQVNGEGEYFPDGKLKQITVVNEIILQNEDSDIFDPNAKPLLELVAEIGESIPSKEWEKVPTDLSINLDHYLYGGRKGSG